MGFDVTIKRHDQKPLGTIQEVRQRLSVVFPGLVINQSPDGPEKLRMAEASGIVFPEILRENIESSSPMHEGDFQGSGFSAHFFFSVSELVQEIHVDIRGDAGAAQPLLGQLETRYGWVTTHP